ncbi:hypothetical protein NKH89_13470 [Mesorhizobium sp. M0923]|uniref:hypothetical protein n=1 Tax=Mesorhizobium sp. L48C026A00 TaxID=1287182 RepID=UPI0003D03CE5|nr:hypothetical protein X737_37440 [Mesorhizobium sp. L48C026A00]
MERCDESHPDAKSEPPAHGGGCRINCRHLKIIDRQILRAAERMTIRDRKKVRQCGRHASTWTPADERHYRDCIDTMFESRRTEVLDRSIGRRRVAGRVFSLLFLLVPQGRLVVLAAIINAEDIQVVRYLKQNRHTPAKPKRSHARPKIVASRASVRKGLQVFAIVHDGIDTSRRHSGRPYLSDLVSISSSCCRASGVK